MMKFARRMERVTPSAIMELIKTTAAGDYISFASGLPDPALYPTDLLRDIADDVLARDGRAALQYGPAEGYGPLREFVAEMLRGRGLPASPDQVLITTGSQQALDLAARALLDPGDHVAIESPSYLAAIQAFDSCEAEYEPISLHDARRRSPRLELHRSKLAYLLPNFQNPTGLTLSAEQRRSIAGLLTETGTALLEDDAYYDLRYEGEPLPPVSALFKNAGSLYTGTFSKTIAPGLRVGYLWGSAPVVRVLTQLKQITDLHTGSFTQRIAYEFCARGHLPAACARLCETYSARRHVMLGELERELSGVVEWTRPGGGMFVWMTLPEGRDAYDLLDLALERKVVFVPGVSFHPDARGENTLRLTFVSASEERIRTGIRVLAGLIREWLAA